MLHLQKAYTGEPVDRLHHLAVANETLIIYSSAQSIVILDAADLSLKRILSFEDVFPGARASTEVISCLSVDSGMKLIVAALDHKIAAWTLSENGKNEWRIHSSLTFEITHDITSLDCKSGLLAVGTRHGLSVHTLILDNDLPTWSPKWTSSIPSPVLSRFSPSLMYITTVSSEDNILRLYSTTSGRKTQEIRHPRRIVDVVWRHSLASSRDDLLLYTITADSTLRVFSPVLDSPQRLQLHASIDLFSSLPHSYDLASQFSSLGQSGVYWLDRSIYGKVISQTLSRLPNDSENASHRRLREIIEEGWDLFLRVLADGSVVISALANIDCRPPTLLRQFTLQHTAPSTFPLTNTTIPDYLYLLPSGGETEAADGLLTLVTSAPLVSYRLDPLQFFDGKASGLKLISNLTSSKESTNSSKILRFTRTPNGGGLAVMRENDLEVWRSTKEQGGKATLLKKCGGWKRADLVAVLDGGHSFVTYSKEDSILVYHITNSGHEMSQPVVNLAAPNLLALFTFFSTSSTGSSCEIVVGVTTEIEVIQVSISKTSSSSSIPSIHISPIALPLPRPSQMIVPVDPMAWSGPRSAQITSTHDDLLSISDDGELAFWVFDSGANSSQKWKQTGKVRTHRTGLIMAKCSSVKKSALVTSTPEGEELTIWDSQESEFASGLEFSRAYSTESINDLDWTSTPDSQSILAIGFAHRVEILCQMRTSYFDNDPRWSVCWSISLGGMIPHPIGDSIWLADGSFMVGSGPHMLLYSQEPTELNGQEPEERLFESVARLNGPLPDYHPQMLLQCLLWGKVELVKSIIVRLVLLVRTSTEEESRDKLAWKPLEIWDYFEDDSESVKRQNKIDHKRQYGGLFSTTDIDNEEEGDTFSRSSVLKLIEYLEEHPLPHLTPNEHQHLLVLIQATLEIDEQRRALDSNGLRYLISMRSFYILNRRVSNPSSPASPPSQTSGTQPRLTGRRERLRFRDMIWAFHSESQEILLDASRTACGGKMGWNDTRALGVALWLKSIDALKAHIEAVARTEYTASDNRDPTACSLYYFALGKAKLVHGLWKQAAWHKEQAAMLKFLNNNFGEARWRTAANKNAFALLSKRRFEYAAAFFLLGGSLKDAVNVCIKQLGDFQLAIVLARIVEGRNDGPILLDILNHTVIPMAFQESNRWLAGWAFWMQGRRDLTIRVLLTPLQDIAQELDPVPSDIGRTRYDDPSLALLFAQLKSKTLQTAKGTSEIPGRLEYKFVLQTARVFTQMGCHALAVSLLRTWSFARPNPTTGWTSAFGPFERGSPTISRQYLPAILHTRRRSSMAIDMDIPSEPPTRRPSPEPAYHDVQHDVIKEEGDLLSRKAGLGSLLKSAKQDVKVQEFDMSAFGF